MAVPQRQTGDADVGEPAGDLVAFAGPNEAPVAAAGEDDDGCTGVAVGQGPGEGLFGGERKWLTGHGGLRLVPARWARDRRSQRAGLKMKATAQVRDAAAAKARRTGGEGSEGKRRVYGRLAPEGNHVRNVVLGPAFRKRGAFGPEQDLMPLGWSHQSFRALGPVAIGPGVSPATHSKRKRRTGDSRFYDEAVSMQLYGLRTSVQAPRRR